MPQFIYTARDANGRTVKAVRAADTEMGLVSILRKEGLVVTSVAPASSASKPKAKRKGKKVKTKDLAILCRQLAAMLEAGLPVLESLDGISDQIENPTLGEILTEVSHDIEAGSTLSQSMGKHDQVFSTLFISMVRSGEESGALPPVLSRLAGYLEARDALTRKIISASTYPAFIAVFFAGAIIAVMFFLIPRFEDIFADFDMTLPPMTQVLIATSRFLGDNIILELLIVAGGSYFLWKWWRTPGGKKQIDALMLKAPLFGKLIRKAAVARFSRTLGTLLSNGVTVIAALEIVGETAGNTVVKEAIDGVGIGVVNGATISEKLAESPVFPKMVVSMVSAGESSGNLPDMLEKIADFYTDEVDAAIMGLTAMIEPALIVGLGGVVAVVVLAIYLPIFSMATGIQ